MKNKTKIDYNKLIIVICISFFVAILNILRVIIGAAYTPVNYVYLAVGHYYLDYFEYVQQIAQGMWGKWLVENQFTVNDPTKTFIGWGQYLLIGKIAKIFNLSAFAGYWLSTVILCLMLVILIYVLIKKVLVDQPFYLQISAFLLTIFAAPFVKFSFENGVKKVIPFDFWYSPTSIFHRFGGVPHHLATTIMTILVIIISSYLIENMDKLKTKEILVKMLIIVFLLACLLTFAPFQVINLLSALGAICLIYIIRNGLINKGMINMKIIYFLATIIIVILPLAWWIKLSHDSGELFKRAIAWEVAQQHHPPLWQILATTGPILIFVPFGMADYLKKLSLVGLTLLLFTFFSYLYFFSPLATLFGTHNLRFLNPLVYVTFAIITILGIKAVSGYFVKQKKTIQIIIISSLLVYFIWVSGLIYKSMSRVDDLSYMPVGVIEAFEAFSKFPDKKAVLTSPAKSLGVIVPVFTDRNVYLGRMIFTPDYEFKASLSDQFYQGQMGEEEAKRFLIDNKIGYILLTSIEYPYSQAALKKYLFLKPVYNNQSAVIFKVE